MDARYLICLFGLLGVAQANDELQSWKEQQMQMMQQEREAFNQYKASVDREFKSFLEAQWREMALFKGERRDEAPKPKIVPKVDKPSLVTLPKPPVVQTKPDKLPSVVEQKPLPISSKSPQKSPVDIAVDKPKGKLIQLSYLGHQLEMTYSPEIAVTLKGKPQSKNIARYWSEVSGGPFEPLLSQLQETAQQYHLNDWGYLLLVRQAASAIHPSDGNSRELLSWFLLIKSGLQVRVGYKQDRLFLFAPSKQRVFERGYLKISDHKYYVYFLPSGETLADIYTYEGEYPATLRPLDFTLSQLPETGQQLSYRKVDFSFSGSKHQLNVPLDQQLLAFYDSYPQLDIQWYFNTPVGITTQQGLLNSLRPVIGDMPKQEALNLLLGLVQSAFPYKTDDEQFGKENYLLPEETLYYPYSDCEDRSVLFAWLVRNLLDLPVIGLSYPGHVATAVKVSGISGDIVKYNGTKYVVADPTYIGATVGMAMPNYRSVSPEVIQLTAN